jgi:hypothetical protein
MAVKAIFWMSLSSLLLSSCSSKTPIAINSNDMELKDQPYFSIHSILPFPHRYVRPDGSVAFTNYEAPKMKKDPQDISIELYHLSNVSCSTSITGSSHMSPFTNANGEAEWGRVDGWDNLKFETGDNPYEGLNNVICNYDGVSPDNTIYTLCGEKNQKTVVVCINQVTKNEDLAKQIFETFHWTN